MSIYKTQSVLSTEPFRVQIGATASGTTINLSQDAVQFAFMTTGNPGTGDWHTGTWEIGAGPTYTANCLVGPANGGVALTVGVYEVWVKVTDNPDVPVYAVGTLKIT